MKNDIYQPTATNDESGVETQVEYQGSYGLQMVWRLVILVLLFLVVAMMVGLIIVSKKLQKLQNCPICPTMPTNGTLA